jgi:hypothetical protein
MAYVPGFEYDLFISYARENDGNSWISIFCEILTRELGELLGRQFSTGSVFFDKKSYTRVIISPTPWRRQRR